MTRQRIMPLSRRSRLARRLGVLVVSGSLAPGFARGQDDRPKPSKTAANSAKTVDSNRPEIALLRLLASHPATAP
ncbi:MAG: hypothetical protein NVSMB14_14220 [Isosphaeraceae bacterium]